MPLFTKHRKKIYSPEGEVLSPEDYEVGVTVEGFSNATGKPNRKPLEFTVTRSATGKAHFTRRGLLG